jgi:hypothetical protein
MELIATPFRVVQYSVIGTLFDGFNQIYIDQNNVIGSSTIRFVKNVTVTPV